MSAYYDLYETPVPEGEEPKSLHVCVCSKGTISGKEFMERVFREEHMPHAMVVGIVQAITTTLGDWLAKGYTVEIEGLGFFSTSLKALNIRSPMLSPVWGAVCKPLGRHSFSKEISFVGAW